LTILSAHERDLSRSSEGASSSEGKRAHANNSPLPAALDQELFNGGGRKAPLHETTLAEYGQHDTTYKG
jgi:hypothetical protein